MTEEGMDVQVPGKQSQEGSDAAANSGHPQINTSKQDPLEELEKHLDGFEKDLIDKIRKKVDEIRQNDQENQLAQ